MFVQRKDAVSRSALSLCPGVGGIAQSSSGVWHVLREQLRAGELVCVASAVSVEACVPDSAVATSVCVEASAVVLAV